MLTSSPPGESVENEDRLEIKLRFLYVSIILKNTTRKINICKTITKNGNGCEGDGLSQSHQIVSLCG